MLWPNVLALLEASEGSLTHPAIGHSSLIWIIKSYQIFRNILKYLLKYRKILWRKHIYLLLSLIQNRSLFGRFRTIGLEEVFSRKLIFLSFSSFFNCQNFEQLKNAATDFTSNQIQTFSKHCKLLQYRFRMN